MDKETFEDIISEVLEQNDTDISNAKKIADDLYYLFDNETLKCFVDTKITKPKKVWVGMKLGEIQEKGMHDGSSEYYVKDSLTSEIFKFYTYFAAVNFKEKHNGFYENRKDK